MASIETRLLVPPEAVSAGRRPAGSLREAWITGDAEIGADAIHGEVVRIGALSIHAELSLVVESGGSQDHTRRKHNQVLETPAIQGKIFDEGAVDDRADGPRFGIH